MTEYNSVGDAEDALKQNNFAYTEWVKGKGPARKSHPQEAEYRIGYARIAMFLSNQQEFEAKLTTVSANMWTEYNRLPSETRNKFTRSLATVAILAGFQFQNRHYLDTSQGADKPMGIRLVGGDPQLGYMLRQKLFWKDSMDLHHGEHSHSLQWVTIAENGNTGSISAADLYSQCSNFRISSADDSKGCRSVTVWEWLADSFPQSMAKNAKNLQNGDDLITTSYRSPQNITDYLFKSNTGKPINGHFVSNYLYYRYINRGWLKAVWTYQQQANKYTLDVTDYYTGDPSSTPVDAMRAKGWKPSPSSPNRYLRDNALSAATKKPNAMPVTFHNTPGALSFHNMQGVQRIMTEKPK